MVVALVTHCKRSHEFTSENTRIRSSGRQECKLCANLLKMQRRLPTRKRPPHCKKGHPYTQESTKYRWHKVDQVYRRECKQCKKDYNEKTLRQQKLKMDIHHNLRATGMSPPKECKKCQSTIFFHDTTNQMESYRCRQCGTEHYAYDAPMRYTSRRNELNSS